MLFFRVGRIDNERLNVGELGNYQVTVDDPVMFLEPWKMDAGRLNLNKTPGIQLMQDVPYNDKSLGNLTDPNYRG